MDITVLDVFISQFSEIGLGFFQPIMLRTLLLFEPYPTRFWTLLHTEWDLIRLWTLLLLSIWIVQCISQYYLNRSPKGYACYYTLNQIPQCYGHLYYLNHSPQVYGLHHFNCRHFWLLPPPRRYWPRLVCLLFVGRITHTHKMPILTRCYLQWKLNWNRNHLKSKMKL